MVPTETGGKSVSSRGRAERHHSWPVVIPRSSWPSVAWTSWPRAGFRHRDCCSTVPGGTGKTALLDRIATRATEFDLRTGELSQDALSDRDSLTAQLLEQAGLSVPRLTGVQFGTIGATTERPPPTRDPFSLLSAWMDAASAGLVLLIDEVHTVDPAVGVALFGGLQQAARRELPLLVVAAGTPDAPRAIRRAGSFMERFFEELPVSRLERAATEAALAEPARARGLPMTKEAVGLLAAASQDYPFFIQLLGSAAWRAAADRSGTRVDEADAVGGVTAARIAMDRFYTRRYAEAEAGGVDHLLSALAARLVSGSGRIGHGALRDLIQREETGRPESPGWVPQRSTLQDLGIVWEVDPGVWEMGIPSFADHVLARSDSSDLPSRSHSD